ncbi:MAG: hypothetical protein WDW38_002000 [Sanguina aurantia]
MCAASAPVTPNTRESRRGPPLHAAESRRGNGDLDPRCWLMQQLPASMLHRLVHLQPPEHSSGGSSGSNSGSSSSKSTTTTTASLSPGHPFLLAAFHGPDAQQRVAAALAHTLLCPTPHQPAPPAQQLRRRQSRSGPGSAGGAAPAAAAAGGQPFMCPSPSLSGVSPAVAVAVAVAVGASAADAKALLALCFQPCAVVLDATHFHNGLARPRLADPPTAEPLPWADLPTPTLRPAPSASSHTTSHATSHTSACASLDVAHPQLDYLLRCPHVFDTVAFVPEACLQSIPGKGLVLPRLLRLLQHERFTVRGVATWPGSAVTLQPPSADGRAGRSDAAGAAAPAKRDGGSAVGVGAAGGGAAPCRTGPHPACAGGPGLLLWVSRSNAVAHLRSALREAGPAAAGAAGCSSYSQARALQQQQQTRGRGRQARAASRRLEGPAANHDPHAARAPAAAAPGGGRPAAAQPDTGLQWSDLGSALAALRDDGFAVVGMRSLSARGPQQVQALSRLLKLSPAHSQALASNSPPAPAAAAAPSATQSADDKAGEAAGERGSTLVFVVLARDNAVSQLQQRVMESGPPGGVAPGGAGGVSSMLGRLGGECLCGGKQRGCRCSGVHTVPESACVVEGRGCVTHACGGRAVATSPPPSVRALVFWVGRMRHPAS